MICSRVKLLGSVVVMGALLGGQGQVDAAAIDEILAPIIAASYNVGGNFVVSGSPNAGVSVIYNDTDPGGARTDVFDFGALTLTTARMASTVSSDGTAVRYSSTAPGADTGLIILRDDLSGDTLLRANLLSLGMNLIPNTVPGASPFAFEGSGDFLVTGGTLAPAFGDTGGLATIGISFTPPITFDASFGALATVSLFPEEDPTTATVPLPAAGWAGLATFGALILGRKKLRSFVA